MHEDHPLPTNIGSGNLTFVLEIGNVSSNDSNPDQSNVFSSECSVHIGELYLLIIIAIESFFLAVSIGISIYMFLGKRRLKGEGIINQTFEGEEGDYIRPTDPQLRLYETILHLSPSRRSSRGSENPYEMLNVNNNNNNNNSQTAVLVAHSREHSYDNIIENSKENGAVPTISQA